MAIQVDIKADKCAVLVVDMLNDFILEGAPIESPGAREIIPTIVDFLDFSRSKDIPVILVQEIHRKEKVDFGRELDREEPEHCLEGTKGVEIHKDLTPKKEDFVVQKRRYSSFHATDLEILLKGLGVDTVIIAGIATNVCVHATALDAQQRDYNVIVLEDGTAATEEGLQAPFLRNIEYVIGDVATTEEVKQELSK
ncbi:MAG TPA: isochorismatase family cysteine hydrolase [Bacillota bacterium]|nr:isochorismatase family cysteine hydrolase [Bacillota bacterium]